MQALPPAIEVYPVHHLPIIKAYADQLGLVGLINHSVPTEMDVDAGTIVLGLVLDTLSGRSPLYRLEGFFAHQDTAPGMRTGCRLTSYVTAAERLALSHPCRFTRG
jgi:Domain of unknown function (DUF4277)